MSAFADSDARAERTPGDVRPVIATGGSGNWGMWAFIVLLLIGGMVLFNALSASREASQVPSVIQPTSSGPGRLASPEPLRIPDRFSAPRLEDTNPDAQARVSEAARLQPSASIPNIPPPFLPPRPQFEPPMLPAPPAAPQVVFDANAGLGNRTAVPATSASGERVKAARLANPARTIPQGTVIPAVLETALDSTRPGGVRALVQRDVSGFDGSKVLIPRGSRLYGEYEAGLNRGQNRALVQWTRLIRPDGVTIALNSPSSDPLGRAGIKGKVDGKFFQRFGTALLQSVLDIGVGLAVNEASDGVIVALPGSTQNVQISDQDTVQPTLKVKHGTSVSVFVARDLDFSSVDP